MATENLFPTIQNLHDVLAGLIARGYGALPVQIVVVPDSTIQSLAPPEGRQSEKPAIMIEYPVADRGLGISFITTERLSASGGMPSRKSKRRELFCWMCGTSHPFGTQCDPKRLAWVQKRRRELYEEDRDSLGETEDGGKDAL